MDEMSQGGIPRGKIGIRLIYTLLFLVILSVMHFLIQMMVLIQYVVLLITRSSSEPLRSLSNKAAVYVYRLIRYTTLNDNTRPFPFTEFPREMDRPEEPVKFD
ncbi:Glucose-1-phosphate thymidylyltransferase, long form [Syntrophobacter sp. SbD2]|nr:Glucose-1-phosphate thymidylyltransferase, long form [Syntrophobacter sp. SbD2]